MTTEEQFYFLIDNDFKILIVEAEPVTEKEIRMYQNGRTFFETVLLYEGNVLARGNRNSDKMAPFADNVLTNEFYLAAKKYLLQMNRDSKINELGL
jgi:hypothetical protein